MHVHMPSVLQATSSGTQASWSRTRTEIHHVGVQHLHHYATCWPSNHMLEQLVCVYYRANAERTNTGGCCGMGKNVQCNRFGYLGSLHGLLLL